MKRASPFAVASDPRHEGALAHAVGQQLLHHVRERLDPPASKGLCRRRGLVFVAQIVDVLAGLLQFAEHSRQSVRKREGKSLQPAFVELVERLGHFVPGVLQLRREDRLAPEQPDERGNVAFGN